ncbi:MAG: threonine ammonia-lyase [Actinomycetales bacterium]|nr:threonine ammonia-lyase [Actinomycetales bacterium]
MATVDLAAVQDATIALAGIASRTPIERSRVLSELLGSPVWLKCENLQRAGSFKIRGAYTRLSRLSPEERERGVVAASAGNHAQGVALAARELGIRATIFMPADAALPKLAATRDYGAEVVLGGASLDEALVDATAFAERTGAVLIHPFDHVDIVAGQGSLGLKILDQVPDVRTILVPLGGGGLAAGIAAALAEAAPHVRVIGVQAENVAAYPGSLAEGRPVAVPVRATMADGIAVGRPGEVPFEILARTHVPVRTVTEEDLSRALLLVVERAKQLVEPSGAAGVAALMADPAGIEGPVVAILSGGNVDPLVLLRVLRHGMTAAGRYLGLHVRISDRPGGLAGLLADVAESGGNVMHVSHVRTGTHLAIGEVEVDLQIETKGPEHCEAVVGHLSAAGYTVRAD